VNDIFLESMDVMDGQHLEPPDAALPVHPGQLPAILAAFIEPALELAQDSSGGGDFGGLIGRAYAVHNDNWRGLLSARYGNVLREFGKALAAVLPGLDKETLYWRLDFLAGALTYAMSDFGLIKRPASASEAEHGDRAARELIRFATAGLLAEAK